MARPKSEDKRNAILEAAIVVFAERGVWSTPMLAISKAAGVAEGTLFTYFFSKEVFVNELYRALKLELADVLLSAFPKSADVRSKFQHIWERYVNWGVANPDKLKVLAQLQLSDQITADSKAVGRAPYAEIERMTTDIIASKQIRDYPVLFIAAIFNSMAETTMATIAQDKSTDTDYCAAGFEIFWKGITDH
ncbi:MAG: TetR/AcrR family transcriptional regulator [Roseiflexaceae bacterium]